MKFTGDRTPPNKVSMVVGLVEQVLRSLNFSEEDLTEILVHAQHVRDLILQMATGKAFTSGMEEAEAAFGYGLRERQVPDHLVRQFLIDYQTVHDVAVLVRSLSIRRVVRVARLIIDVIAELKISEDDIVYVLTDTDRVRGYAGLLMDIRKTVHDMGGTDEDLGRLYSDTSRQARVRAIAIAITGALDVARRSHLGITGLGETMPEDPAFQPFMESDLPPQHVQLGCQWRLINQTLGVADNVPVIYLVREGVDFKTVPSLGPCHNDFRELLAGRLPREQSSRCLVFWVPRLLAGTEIMSYTDQVAEIERCRVQYDLPQHHLSGLREAWLVSGLILSHYEATGECLPHNGWFARTETGDMGIIKWRVGGFKKGGTLQCHPIVGIQAQGDTGAFLIGIERRLSM